MIRSLPATRNPGRRPRHGLPGRAVSSAGEHYVDIVGSLVQSQYRPPFLHLRNAAPATGQRVARSGSCACDIRVRRRTDTSLPQSGHDCGLPFWPDKHDEVSIHPPIGIGAGDGRLRPCAPTSGGEDLVSVIRVCGREVGRPSAMGFGDQMKRLGTFLVILALLAGGAISGATRWPLSAQGGRRTDRRETSAPSVAKAPDSPAEPARTRRPRLGPRRGGAPRQDARAYVAPKEVEFAFRRLEIDTSKGNARGLLVFTREFKTDGSVRYGTIWRSVRRSRSRCATADRLCVAGLAYNADLYADHARGLPGGERRSWPRTRRSRSNCATSRPGRLRHRLHPAARAPTAFPSPPSTSIP